MQSRWAINKPLCQLSSVGTTKLPMRNCIILHNMIVEDTYDEDDHRYKPTYAQVDDISIGITRFHTLRFSKKEYHSNETYARLKQDLIDELWDRHSQRHGHN